MSLVPNSPVSSITYQQGPNYTTVHKLQSNDYQLEIGKNDKLVFYIIFIYTYIILHSR